MPDWITHVLISWTIVTVLGFKFKEFSQQNSAIVILGALIPDIYKINLLLMVMGIQIQDFLMPFHFPIGSLLIACLASLFFIDRRKILFFLIFGIITHYALDLLLFSGIIKLFYPLSPLNFQIGIISVTDYNITIISIIAAGIVYLIYKKSNNANNLKNLNY